MSERGTSGVGRRSAVLLVASLALNLLVIGAVAGTALIQARRATSPETEGPGGLTAGSGAPFQGFLTTLPPERRRALRRAFLAERPDIMPLRRAFDAARADLAALIEAEPLDRSAVDAAMRRMWTAEGELRRQQLAVIARLLPMLTHEERVHFVAWRRRALAPWLRRGWSGADEVGPGGDGRPLDTGRPDDRGAPGTNALRPDRGR